MNEIENKVRAHYGLAADESGTVSTVSAAAVQEQTEEEPDFDDETGEE